MTEAVWRALAEKALGGRSVESLASLTAEGLRIEPLSPRCRTDPPAALRQSEGSWQIAQRVDHPDAAEANRLALADLEGGADALTLVFAGETARGYGLPLEGDALAEALQHVELDLIGLRLDAGSRAAEAARLLSVLTARRRLGSARLTVDLGLDPLGSFARTGTAAAAIAGRDLRSFRETMRGAGLAGCVFLADGRPYHEAGAGEAQELAAVLATASAYLRRLEMAGISLAEASADIAFLLVADAEIILTLAKFRALRRLWARVEEACGLEPHPARIHAETAWRMMTRRDPATNLMRATAAVFASSLGGADIIAVLPSTAALGVPDAAARRLARTTQLILQREALLAAVDDPAAGSGGLEATTDALCTRAWALFQEIEAEGGMQASLHSGAMQGRVAATAKRRREAVATGLRGITGTSVFPSLEEAEALRSLPRGPAAPPGPLALVPVRDAEPFEALRDRADAAAAEGMRPTVFVATLGAPAAHGARAAFSAAFFAGAGVRTVTAAHEDYDASVTPVVCLCGADDADGAAQPVAALRAAGARRIMVAGAPDAGDRTMGADVFIHSGCNAPQILAETLDFLLATAPSGG